MAYKDKQKQREFARSWIANKKKKFLEGKQCERCGSSNNLHLFSSVAGKTIRQLTPWNNLSIPVDWYKVKCSNCVEKYASMKKSERKPRVRKPKTVAMKPENTTKPQKQVSTWALSLPTPEQIQRAEEIGKRMRENDD